MADRFLLVLWLTSRCNLHCSYCYAGACDRGRDMDFETAKKALDALKGRPLKIQFAGGEPLLNFPLAEKICSYVRDQNMDAVFNLQTNGTLLTEDLVRRLKVNRISVGVSLDGIPEINSLTRGKTPEAVRGIRLLAQAGETIGLNAVVTGRTVKALPKLLDFALYLQNVGGIGLDLLRHAGRGTQEPEADPEDLKAALIAMDRRSREIEKTFGVRIGIREIELARKRLSGRGNRDRYCYASCGRSLVVLPDGKTYPCGSLTEEKYFMGNIQDLSREKLLALNPKREDGCKACRYLPYCPGGCPARRIRNGGSLDCTLLKTAFMLAEREKYDH